MADVLRAPSYCRVTPRPFLQGLVAPNLLLSTLAVVAAVAPFSQEDWQAPQKARRIGSDQVVPNLLLTTFPVTTAPAIGDGATQTWRKPVLSAQIPPNTLILGFPSVVSTPFAQSDWPGPARRGRVYADAAGTLLAQGIPPAVVSAPFAQTDWQPPNVRAKATQFATAYPNVTTRLVPPPPFKQTEWQTLKKRKFVPLVIDPPNLLLKTLVIPPVVLPFALRDWPQVYRHPIKYDIAWVNSQIPNTIPEPPEAPAADMPRKRTRIVMKVERTQTVTKIDRSSTVIRRPRNTH